MVKKRVEFDAHEQVKKTVKVEFETSTGKKVKFPARKNVKVPVHVKFKADK